MKITCSKAFIVSIFFSVCLLGLSQVKAAPIAPCSGEPIDPSASVVTGVVDWGSGPSVIAGNIPPGTLRDDIPPDSELSFRWTDGTLNRNGQTNGHCGFSPYNSPRNITTQPIPQYFIQPVPRPGDPPITDWRQTVTKFKTVNGREVRITSDVVSGNIQHDSPWSFHPLSELPNISWKIPDLAPFQGTSDLTIYTAVNLDVYLNDNPNGFLGGNWSNGQTLDDLGIHIINGQILGVNGIYWATTEFTFDPDSATGWVPIGGSSNFLNSDDWEGTFGDIGILASHASSIPEPSTLSLVVLCIFGIFCPTLRWRARVAGVAPMNRT
ncbi:MAG: hypothetical protein LM522_04450 [Candidatus Contendobacter sp.]|nr:hypothetical protein [Candidatus Contendobacter sp.]